MYAEDPAEAVSGQILLESRGAAQNIKLHHGTLKISYLENFSPLGMRDVANKLD